MTSIDTFSSQVLFTLVLRKSKEIWDKMYQNEIYRKYFLMEVSSVLYASLKILLTAWDDVSLEISCLGVKPFLHMWQNIWIYIKEEIVFDMNIF